MPRFVVLVHDHPTLHWDLMLENEASLRTWRLARPPSEEGPISAEPLAPHRLAYLEYEGPVSGNRGFVRRFDRGNYRLVEEHGGRVTVELEGDLLRGTGLLEQTNEVAGWTFSYLPAGASP